MRLGARPENPGEWLALKAGQVPTVLVDGYLGFMAARCVMAGVSLGVFEALDEQPDDVSGLAGRLELDAAGVDVLLTALHACDYVKPEGGRFVNTPAVRRFALDASTQSLTSWAGVFAYDMWEHFGRLEDTLRTGRPIGLHERGADDPYWERYMRGLFDLSKLSADIVARLIPVDRAPGRLLDLAGGHGGYAMAMCRRHPGLRATILELEGSARIGRAIVAEQGMADRVAFTVGDLFEADLGEGHDVATAFQIVHHFAPEQNVELLSRARATLRPGGTVAILELERPRGRQAADQVGALTGVLFYVTSRARTFTAREMADFLGEAGFREMRARRHAQLPGVVVMVATA
jgi:ubiquinone/menaquinone biosynthesis C-methylase UbiE